MCERTDILVAAGAWGEVRYAMRRNGSLPAKEFFDGCSNKNQIKLTALFQWIANEGRIPNWEKFHQVEGDVFEIKSHQIRVSCYRNGMSWFLLHGFMKQKRFWSAGDLSHAQLIMAENKKRLQH